MTPYPTNRPTKHGQEPTNGPTEAPTAVPTLVETSAPTHDIEFWRDCTASGGWYSSTQAVSKEKKCIFPFTYEGVEYNQCVNVHSQAEPLRVNAAKKPKNKTADMDLWCAVHDIHAMNPTKYRRWGYCACDWNTNSPTKDPTPSPTKLTSAPTTATPTTATPTTATPTNYPTSQPTRSYGIYKFIGSDKDCKFTSTARSHTFGDSATLEQCKLACDDDYLCTRILFKTGECKTYAGGCKRYDGGDFSVYTRTGAGTSRTSSPTAPTMQKTSDLQPR